MDLPLITMPKEEARREERIFRALLNDPKRRHTKADETAHRAYRALAGDRTVLGLISLVEAFRRAGVDEQGRPRLAIARADRERVSYVQTLWRGDPVVFDDPAIARGRRLFAGRSLVSTDGLRIVIPAGTLPTPPDSITRSRSYEAIVPSIPPELRPNGTLTGYHVLWEAEWLDAPIPPGDPALLRCLGGDLWAVYATWDLTEVERLALAVL